MEFESISVCPDWDEAVPALGGTTPREAFKGDKSAAVLVSSIIVLVNIWDDLIDKDHPVTNTEINAAFFCALSEIPQNPFFASHRDYLQPLMDTMMTCYFCANHWEQSKDEHGMEIGHVLRYAPAFVIGAVLNIIHGGVYPHLPILYRTLCGERAAEYFQEQEAKP